MIVEEAKVSTGSFCMYFRNKEDVFDAALEELGEAIDRALDEVKQSQPDPLKRIAQGPSHCSYSSRKIRSGPHFACRIVWPKPAARQDKALNYSATGRGTQANVRVGDGTFFCRRHFDSSDASPERPSKPFTLGWK
jgi:Bacterial regulatory proteins, tetR family.